MLIFCICLLLKHAKATKHGLQSILSSMTTVHPYPSRFHMKQAKCMTKLSGLCTSNTHHLHSHSASAFIQAVR